MRALTERVKRPVGWQILLYYVCRLVRHYTLQAFCSAEGASQIDAALSQTSSVSEPRPDRYPHLTPYF